MTLTATARRLRKRIHNLPTATAVSHRCEIWVRRNGYFVCKTCGKP